MNEIPGIYLLPKLSGSTFKVDGFVKSKKISLFVIPAKAVLDSDRGTGIQSYKMVPACLDSGFHRSDDFYEIIKIKHTLKGLAFAVS
jgi:hypothetical protein